MLPTFSGCSQRTINLRRAAHPHQGPDFKVQYSALDEQLIPEIIDALTLAVDRSSRWCSLRYPVVVHVHPDHDALERAIGRRNYPWLRAWAQYRDIHLQSPRTWGIPYQAQLRELLAHELTHVAMYQAIGREDDWEEREIPLWFREGMASLAAEQGYRRGSEAEIALSLNTRRHLDPVYPTEAILRSHKDLVYSACHWAFHFLLEIHGSRTDGDVRIKELLARVRRGRSFGRAFGEVWGMSEEQFLRRWRQHLQTLVPAA